jgi:hypothetical protein
MRIHTRFLPFSSAGELGVVLFAAGLGVPGILQESASFNRAFSSVEPTLLPGGMVVDVGKGKHL